MVHVPLMFLSEWHEFPPVPFLAEKKKLDESSRLDVVEIVHVAWHAFFQSVYQEKNCNSAHEQTPLSKDITDSVLRHGEEGRTKDVSASPLISILSFFNKLFVLQSSFLVPNDLQWVKRQSRNKNKVYLLLKLFKEHFSIQLITFSLLQICSLNYQFGIRSVKKVVPQYGVWNCMQN